MDANRAMPDRLGVLVVGAGFLGRQRAAAAKVASRTRLVAVTDADPTSARIVADRLGVPAVSDLDAGLAIDGVDAVVVATPHADHEHVVRLALDAGKQVLCEKPLAIDPEDCRDPRASGRRRGPAARHRIQPSVLPARARRPGPGLRVEDRSGGERPPHDRPCGDAGIPRGMARRSRRLGRWDDDGQRRPRLRPGEEVPGRDRRRQGVHAGRDRPAVRHRVRGVRPVPQPRSGHGGGSRSSWTLGAGYLTIEVRGSAGHIKVETAPWRLSGRLAYGYRLDRHYVAERLFEKVHRARFSCERSLVHELDDFATLDPDHPRASATGWDGARATEMADAVYARRPRAWKST